MCVEGTDFLFECDGPSVTLVCMTSQTGLLRGTTIELETTVPEMDGKRVHVLLEPVDEQQVSARHQAELWQAWVDRGPDGPIEDATDTETR
jgi:hypothetical protein